MLERYFIRPDTVDRIRASWIGEAIERYVAWLAERGYAPRNVFRRVPILRRFGEFARAWGATAWEQLPVHVSDFVEAWVREQGQTRTGERARNKVAQDARNPIEQMLRCLAVPGFSGTGRPRWAREPFPGRTGGFFEYLRDERGLRSESILHYRWHLGPFEAYLEGIQLHDWHGLSPVVLDAFIADRSRRLGRTSRRDLCGVLRIFLRSVAILAPPWGRMDDWTPQRRYPLRHPPRPGHGALFTITDLDDFA